MKSFFEVAPNRIVRSGQGVFTYSVSESDDNADNLNVQVGSIVTIPIGKTVAIGVVMRKVPKPTYETRDIINVVENTPLPIHLIKAAEWISEYYNTPLATVLTAILPRGLDKKRRQSKERLSDNVRERIKIVLNKEQVDAVKNITEATGTVILQGVTGSGKTEVYKEIVRKQKSEGKSSIVLVPEIGLTQQLVDEFSADFPEAIITHSKMTEAERHIAWQKILNSIEPQIIIGPRSALFMPVQKLGTIIIDEAHEPSYKQEQAPRYSALRVASVMSKLTKSVAILGSATPSITDIFTADQNSAPIIKLHKRARKNVSASEVSCIDMTKKDNLSTSRHFSKKLIQEIEKSLKLKEQVLIFHNRRGSASTTLCESCGWTATCTNCFVPYVLHEDTFKLTCHICNQTQKAMTSCPECRSADIIHKGIGTKRVEAELQRIFPRVNIARFDSDNKPEETLANRYSELYNGDVQIIIGTQVVAKGLDLPHLRTVGVIQADSGLSMPDFAATERTFQLLSQVVGRVGRDDRETNVVVQTYQPTHPAVKLGLKQDYDGFYQYAIAERQRAKFPPYRYILQLTTVYKTEEGAVRAARNLKQKLQKELPKSIEILGPTPAFYERQRNTYRWQIILKSARRQDLVEALQHLPPKNWQYELDPTSLI